MLCSKHVENVFKVQELRKGVARKRCLNRKQRDCRQRKKEETKGAETTLSRLWVISENISAAALLIASYKYSWHCVIVKGII